MKTTVIALIILAALTASAQTRTFRWDDELCQYTGTYDAKKITLAALQNTLKLSRPGSYSLETNSTVWKFSDIAELDIAALDSEYAQKSAELKALDIVHGPYWEALKQKKLLELDQVYRLNQTTMRAYRDQRILLEYKDAPACTTKYANPLISGGDDLLKAWRTVNEDSRQKNADPERLRKIFEDQFSSENKMRFALIDVMTFGWSNCANALIDYVSYDGTHEQEFKKLFKRTKTLSCDEP